MDISIQNTFLPHNDPEAAIAFYRDVLGFEVRNDVGQDRIRWITVGPPGNERSSIVLYPLGGDPSVSEEEQRTIAEMMAKGNFAMVTLATPDLDGDFGKLAAAGAEVVQEPTDQFYGVRDGAIRDPAGNLIRINQLG
jgi:uncharacterized glyoxalase superfamily protein PhnB